MCFLLLGCMFVHCPDVVTSLTVPSHSLFLDYCNLTDLPLSLQSITFILGPPVKISHVQQDSSTDPQTYLKSAKPGCSPAFPNSVNSLITPKFPSAPISYKSLLFSSLGTNNLCHFFPPNLSVFLISTITHKIPFLEHFSSFLTGFVVSALTTGNLFSPQWSQPFWHQGPVSWKIIFPSTRGEEWFWDD